MKDNEVETVSIMTKNLDSRPYTGDRMVQGKVQVKTHEEAAWLDGYFDGTPNYSQVTTLTRGKIYDVKKVVGYGDVEGIVVINDLGNEEELCDFFFKEVQEDNKILKTETYSMRMFERRRIYRLI